MIKISVQNALNKQLNAELYSSYVYLSMSAFFESQSLNGFAHWMTLQSQEEYAHAMKIYSFIHQRNGKVTLSEIAAPKSDWKSPLEAFEDVFKQEQEVSESINHLAELSISEKDYATNNFLQWFISEQVEEEATALNVLDKVKLIGDNRNGLFFLDREMGMRATQ